MLHLLQAVADYGLRRTTALEWGDWNKLYAGEINAEVLIMGSSTAFVQIDPTIIEEGLGMPTYNLAMNGHRFDFQYFKLKEYLKYNQRPKMIIQVVDYATMDSTESFFAPQFIPYLDKRAVKEKLSAYDKDYQWLNFIPLMKYKGRSREFLNGFISIFNDNGIWGSYKKGYLPRENKWNEIEFTKYLEQNPNGPPIKFSKYIMNDFTRFVRYCNTNEIDLVFIKFPRYHQLDEITDFSQFNSFYDQLSTMHTVKNFDFQSQSFIYKKKYFYNSTHLNKTGANIFSKEIVDLIKNHD
ncbi:hypothetical protein [Penaeicola halotolerans]|uniref:hypothetical protein n=1 Tax=Penaeicola halotolerans TaxID=2793196 RepID=UPI001CF8296F|nr:hypothetical protein [Penaeicola halotolerans]